MRDRFRLIIPTRDSAAWIGAILDRHLSLGVSPLVVIDTRTSDNTRDIVLSRGVSFLEFTPRGDYPEAGMLEFAAENAGADWVLRLDDDELPSRALVEFVGSVGVKSKNQCWFFERRELYREDGRVVFSQSPGKYPLPDYPQYLQPMGRLHHVDRVNYLEEVHTVGFRELKLFGFAPKDAFIVHLNCLLNSFSRRLSKVLRYEEIKPGVSWALADEYLPELFDADFHKSSDEGIEEFNDFINALPRPEPLSAKQLARADIEYAHACVAERLENLKAARIFANGVRRNADDVSWIDYAPPYARRPLAKFLCSVPINRLRRTGIALWDYLEFYERQAQV